MPKLMPDWTTDPTGMPLEPTSSLHTDRRWLAAIAASSLAAVIATAVCAFQGISLVVYVAFYVPIILAAYRYLWRGALVGGGLAVTYIAIMTAAFHDDTAVLTGAATRTVGFVAMAACVALLAGGARGAQRRIAAQRDLALQLDASRSVDQAARATVATLVTVPSIDAAVVYVSEKDEGFRLAAHVGLSPEFVDHVATVGMASPHATHFTETVWDAYPHLLEQWDMAGDEVRAAEGLAGFGMIPIRDEGLMLGALVVASRSLHFIRPGTQTVVELAAAQVGAAMARIRSSQTMHRQHAHTEALYEAAQALTQTTDYDLLLAEIASQVALAVGSDECHIWSYDKAADTQSCVACFVREQQGDGARLVIGTVLELNDYPTAREMMRGRDTWELHLSDPAVPPEERHLMERLGDKTTLHVPLHHGDELIGQLVLVETRGERHFTDEEIRLIQALGEHAVTVLENARLYESLEDQNRRLEAVLESARAMTSSMDVDDVLNETVRRTAEALGSPLCALYEYRPVDERLLCKALHADPGVDEGAVIEPELPLTESGPYWRALHGQRIVSERLCDPAIDPASRSLMTCRAQRSILGVPLVFGGTTIGLLIVIETGRDRSFTADDVKLAEALAGQAAIAINNARLFKAAEEQAIRDGLTGLYNHRYFYSRLSQEVTRAHRYGEPAALLMLDIDDFKHVNDHYGHPVGDEILRAVAQVMRTQVRQDLDLAARYGGEEFALLLPNTPIGRGVAGPLPGRARAAAQERWASGAVVIDRSARGARSSARRRIASGPLPWRPDGALAIAERIRAMVAASTYAAEVVPGGVRVTVSIGVAGWTDDAALGPNELVARADKALYAAKQAGKDRCVVFRDERASA
jgi:GAF domain-containing protein